MKITPVCCAGALLLGGCVSSKIDVVESGARPDLRARGVMVAQADKAATEPAPPVAAKLQAAGLPMRDAPGDGYLVELSYSERPSKVGAYAGPEPASGAAREAWVAPPEKPRWWAPGRGQLCTLTARVIDPASGGEAYRVRASVKGRQPDCGEAAEGLSTAVAGRLAPAP